MALVGDWPTPVKTACQCRGLRVGTADSESDGAQSPGELRLNRRVRRVMVAGGPYAKLQRSARA